MARAGYYIGVVTSMRYQTYVLLTDVNFFQFILFSYDTFRVTLAVA